MKHKKYKMWMNTVTGEAWMSMTYTRKRWKQIKEVDGKPSQWKRVPQPITSQVEHLYDEMEWRGWKKSKTR